MTKERGVGGRGGKGVVEGEGRGGKRDRKGEDKGEEWEGRDREERGGGAHTQGREEENGMDSHSSTVHNSYCQY